MKKLYLILFIIVGICAVIQAQEKNLLIALSGDFYSFNSSAYQAKNCLDKKNNLNTAGEVCGYGTSTGINIDAYYYFYKGIGVTAGITFMESKNNHKFQIPEPSSTAANYNYKNTLPMNMIKLGIAGKINIPETNVELFTSVGANILLARFYKQGDIDYIDDAVPDSSFQWESENYTFAGPYFRVGATYNIISWLSIYAAYEYTIVNAEYKLELKNVVDGNQTKHIYHSDLGGSTIRMGLAVRFDL